MTPQLHALCSLLITKDEEKRFSPYDDKTGFKIMRLPSGGKITIGIGRNLCDKPLRDTEVAFLFSNDLADAELDAIACTGGSVNWLKLSVNRQAALISMAFNLGAVRLSGFVNTLLAVKEGRYNDAAQGMRTSKWAIQVGNRAERLARMMEDG